MSFEKIVRIPNDRIGVIIGKSGAVKNMIEKACSVTIDIDGESGEALIRTSGNVENIQPFKAIEIVTAIARGFSPENAMTLLKGENALHVIDLREFTSKSSNQLERIKGRIIGENGKARKNMEQLTGTKISVYGKTISVIGDNDKLKLVVDAISSLSKGSIHGSVYKKLESANRRNKMEKMRLWENQDVF